MTSTRRLHRRLLTVMGLAALAAFIAGAGYETPTLGVTAGMLLLALFWEPSPAVHARLEIPWRIAAVALSIRAVYYIFTVPQDVVLPMVDVLLVLIASEALRPARTTGDTRLYSLSFALLVASTAYRPGIVFGIAFIIYTICGTVALLVGHLVRQADTFNTGETRLQRGFLPRVAVLSLVMLAMSGLLFVAFPRVARSWVTRNTPAASSVVGFSDRVSLAAHGGRIYPNPQVVLRVEFPEGVPPNPQSLYWRGRSYDEFDGVAWSRGRAGSWASERINYHAAWPDERIVQRIFATPLDVPVVFGMHPVLHVQPVSRMQVLEDRVGDIFYDGPGSPSYQVTSILRSPSDDSLRAVDALTATNVSRDEMRRRSRFDMPYLQLPEITTRTRRLADSLTANVSTRLDKARAIEMYLHGFTYTLDLPATEREASLDYFLFERRAGHCEYFSTAMVVLLRSAGIPARNVNGFLGGDWNDFGRYLSVTQNNAHSWVEVFFPHYGWVPFDPTPAAAGGVSSAQTPWFSPVRFLFDGLEHRWNKWVLEYNVDTQVRLFSRAAEALRPEPARPVLQQEPASRRWVAVLLGLVVVWLAVRVLFGRRRGPALTPEARIYLMLRRTYRKAGFETETDPPLLFVRRLETSGAPGAADARAVVSLYLDARFGARAISTEERKRMQAAAGAATRAVRQARSD